MTGKLWPASSDKANGRAVSALGPDLRQALGQLHHGLRPLRFCFIISFEIGRPLICSWVIYTAGVFGSVFNWTIQYKTVDQCADNSRDGIR